MARKLSIAAITAVALRVADREGLEAISIRRIADELGAGPMSLYRHVSNKDEILDLLLDAAYGEIVVPAAPSGNWKRDLGDMARETRKALKKHWWLGPLLTSRPTFGPHYLRWFEFLLATTASAGKGIGIRGRVRVIGTVFAYVAGVVGYELGDEAANRRHKLSPARKREVAASHLAPLLATGRFPNLAEFVQRGTDASSDEDFEFGLQCVLDGLAAPAANRRSSTSGGAGRRTSAS